MPAEKELYERIRRIQEGGAEKYHEANKKKGKLFVRDRLKLLLDEGLDLEDAFFANCMADGLPADGVVTGIGKIGGRTVASWPMIQLSKQDHGEREPLKKSSASRKQPKN